MKTIIDSTLREGEQTPGVIFSASEKLNIIDGLASVGIKEIEIGIASSLIKCPARLLDYCRLNYPSLTCSLWSRCIEADIKYAANIMPDIISLSIPVSDILIHEKMAKTREWVHQQMVTSLHLAKHLGMVSSIGFEDATRAEISFLKHLALEAEQCGAKRIRLADTVGISSPAEMATLVKNLKSCLKNSTIAVHTHNDFGMATANAISSMENGASHADGTLLGLGERCGCARLEELVGYFHLIKGHDYNLSALPAISKYVANLSKRDIPPNQPFIGKRIFTCETGLHLHGLQKNPKTYEPYPPEMVGAERRLSIGQKSGRRAIINHLKTLGYPVGGSLKDKEILFIRNALAKRQTGLNQPGYFTSLKGLWPRHRG